MVNPFIVWLHEFRDVSWTVALVECAVFVAVFVYALVLVQRSRREW